MSEWISVEDRLPEGDCLVFTPGERTKMHTASYHHNVVIIGSHFKFDREPVTHWQPLPEPPK
jgi:hypothetical protein